MTSRRPCWRSKQRNGGHVGGVKYSFGDWTLFLCKFLLLFHYAKYGFWSHERTHYKLKLINQNDWLTDYIYRLKFHGTLGGRSFLIVLGVLIIVFFFPSAVRHRSNVPRTSWPSLVVQCYSAGLTVTNCPFIWTHFVQVVDLDWQDLDSNHS